MKCRNCGKEYFCLGPMAPYCEDCMAPYCEDCMDWMEQYRLNQRHESRIIVGACLVGMALIALFMILGG